MPGMVTCDGFNKNTVRCAVDEQQLVEEDAVKSEAEGSSDLCIRRNFLDFCSKKICRRQTAIFKHRMFPELGPR